MTRRPPTIGIVGGIGSGKSTVATTLDELGCVIACADANVKKILATKEIQEELVAWWGNAVLDADGELNTKAIADLVFNNEKERGRLEQLLHPLARNMQEAAFEQADQHTKACVIDAPLLLETSLAELCDFIIFVEVSTEIRQNRVIASRGWTAEELERRESTQLPLDIKRKRADYIVTNEGDLDNVKHQVEQILEDIETRQRA
jgi:dephospho-CoA kinase